METTFVLTPRDRVTRETVGKVWLWSERTNEIEKFKTSSIYSGSHDKKEEIIIKPIGYSSYFRIGVKQLKMILLPTLQLTLT